MQMKRISITKTKKEHFDPFALWFRSGLHRATDERYKSRVLNDTWDKYINRLDNIKIYQI